MELLLFRPQVFEEYYNCSFYEVKVHKQIQHPFLSLTYITLASVLMAIYIPCLCIMVKANLLQQSCFKIMFYMGLLDVPGIFIAGIITGFFGVFGISFCDAPKLIYAIGSMAEFTWHSQIMSAVFLAVNRCTIMLHRRLANVLFDGNRTWLWIATIPFAYGLFMMWFAQPIVFSLELMMWLFNPHFGYFEDTEGRYFGLYHLCSNIFIIVAMPTVYTVFGIIFYCSRKSADSNGNNKGKSALSVFYQVGIICTITLTLAILYVVAQYVHFPIPMYYCLQALWIVYVGSPSLIYVTMNKTIREWCARSIVGDRYKPTVSPMGRTTSKL